MYVWLGVACLVAGLVIGRLAPGPLAPPHRRRGRGAPRRGVGGQRGQPDVRVLPDLRPPVRQERQPLPRQCAARPRCARRRPGAASCPTTAPPWSVSIPGKNLKFTPRPGVRVGAPGVVRARPSPSCRSSCCCTARRASLRTGPARLRRRDVAGLRRAAQRGGADPRHAGHQRILGRGLRVRQQRDLRRGRDVPDQDRARVHAEELQRRARAGIDRASPGCPRAACAPPPWP